jgi:hypothetical protein
MIGTMHLMQFDMGSLTCSECKEPSSEFAPHNLNKLKPMHCLSTTLLIQKNYH